MYDALEKKGVLAFDISQLVPGKPESSWWIDRRMLNAEDEVVGTIFSKRNPQTNMVEVNLFFDVYTNGRLRDRYYDYGEVMISSKDKVEMLLKNGGFKVKNVYGDFDKSAYNRRSQRGYFCSVQRIASAASNSNSNSEC